MIAPYLEKIKADLIEYVRSGFTDTGGLNHYTYLQIISAVDKQIPKPPHMACGHTVDRSMNYCPLCGQRLKWEG
jgi:hypothetical protein